MRHFILFVFFLLFCNSPVYSNDFVKKGSDWVTGRAMPQGVSEACQNSYKESNLEIAKSVLTGNTSIKEDALLKNAQDCDKKAFKQESVIEPISSKQENRQKLVQDVASGLRDFSDAYSRARKDYTSYGGDRNVIDLASDTLAEYAFASVSSSLDKQCENNIKSGFRTYLKSMGNNNINGASALTQSALTCVNSSSKGKRKSLDPNNPYDAFTILKNDVYRLASSLRKTSTNSQENKVRNLQGEAVNNYFDRYIYGELKGRILDTRKNGNSINSTYIINMYKRIAAVEQLDLSSRARGYNHNIFDYIKAILAGLAYRNGDQALGDTLLVSADWHEKLENPKPHARNDDNEQIFREAVMMLLAYSNGTFTVSKEMFNETMYRYVRSQRNINPLYAVRALEAQLMRYDLVLAEDVWLTYLGFILGHADNSITTYNAITDAVFAHSTCTLNNFKCIGKLVTTYESFSGYEKWLFLEHEEAFNAAIESYHAMPLGEVKWYRNEKNFPRRDNEYIAQIITTHPEAIFVTKQKFSYLAPWQKSFMSLFKEVLPVYKLNEKEMFATPFAIVAWLFTPVFLFRGLKKKDGGWKNSLKRYLNSAVNFIVLYIFFCVAGLYVFQVLEGAPYIFGFIPFGEMLMIGIVVAFIFFWLQALSSMKLRHPLFVTKYFLSIHKSIEKQPDYKPQRIF